jgi:molecular chaperone GrpE
VRRASAEQEETNNRLLRTAAELQNVRRRAAKEQRRRATQARASALRPMLEVLDDLQRALAAADDDAEGDETGDAFESLRSGIGMVENKFESALAGLGVEPIAAEGEPFDETLHEAMMQQPAPEGTDPGTVLAEIRRGYRMETSDDEEERVLRHSRVVVAVAAEEEESGAAEEDHEENGSADE